MDYRRVSQGLGWFSLVLGAAELLAPKTITGTLDAQGHEGLVKGFGAREVVAGLTILANPAHAAGPASRVAGDALDLGALALAARNAPRNPWVWGAIGFVIGVAVVDAITAQKLKEAPDPAPDASGPRAPEDVSDNGTGSAASATPDHTASRHAVRQPA